MNLKKRQSRVSQLDLSFASALITAGAWLETGKATAVLVGAVDEWCEVAGYCMWKMADFSETPTCSFGEGSAFFLVTKDSEKIPEYGCLEEFSMGRNFDGNISGDTEVIFSPSSTEPCRAGEFEKIIDKKCKLRVRSRGKSPTDMAMDILFAFLEKRKSGRRICCVKQGECGMFAKVTVTCYQ